MGGFCDRALNVEVKHRLRRTRRFFGQSTPCPLAAARRTLSDAAVPNEIDIGMRRIGGPIGAEIFEERIPVRRQAMTFEIVHREGEAVIDTNDGRHAATELHY